MNEDDFPDLSPFASSLMRRSELASLPPVEPLIEGVLSLRSAAILFGPTGAGKTFVGLSWACSVGTGLSWLGRPVCRAPAMYVVGEGAAGLDVRIRAWEYAWGTKVSDDDVLFSVKPASLLDREVWQELTKEALAHGVRFVVLDTFSSLAPDADETKDAPTFTRRLSDLAADIDGTALTIHHPGWSDSDRTRGGYQLEANVDEVLKLTAGTGSDLVELTRKKVKEGESGQRLWLKRRYVGLGYNDAGEQTGSLVIEQADRSAVSASLRDRLLTELEDMGTVGATGPQLLAALGLAPEKRSGLYRALSGLAKEDQITRDGPRGRERFTVKPVNE